jgi:hypothetical protein
MPAYSGLAGGKTAADRINRGKATRSAQRAQSRANPLPGTGGF